MSKKKEGNALPFEVERGFTAMPNSISDYYTMHPRFTGATERLYLYLLRNYREDIGYAYPGYKAIREHTKIRSDETISNAIESLKHLELIRVEQIRLNNGHKSNRYYFVKPIEDYDEFMRKFGGEISKKFRNEKPRFIAEDNGDVIGFDELEHWL